MRFRFVVLMGGLGLATMGGLLVVPAQTAVAPSTGRVLFHEKGCDHCHGESLRGTDKGPSLLGVGRRKNAEQLHSQIHDGGQNMPAFGEAVDETEEGELVKFLGTLKTKEKAGHK